MNRKVNGIELHDAHVNTLRSHVTSQRPKLTDRRYPVDFADDSGEREAQAEREYSAGNVVYC